MQTNESPSPKQPEVWMRGPVAGVPALLQPVAHALLQAQEEIHALMKEFPEALIWERPGESASPAFHLQHIPGVLDRLFTYARNESLSNAQLKYLSEEGLQSDNVTIGGMLDRLDTQIEICIDWLRSLSPETLTEARAVGRKKLPSTVMGLLFHAAEHTMRHTGQLLVTVRWVMEES